MPPGCPWFAYALQLRWSTTTDACADKIPLRRKIKNLKKYFFKKKNSLLFISQETGLKKELEILLPGWDPVRGESRSSLSGIFKQRKGLRQHSKEFQGSWVVWSTHRCPSIPLPVTQKEGGGDTPSMGPPPGMSHWELRMGRDVTFLAG